MASRAKGEVKVREWKSGRSFALRFWAYGERRYVTLGSEARRLGSALGRRRAGERPRRRATRGLGAAEPEEEGAP